MLQEVEDFLYIAKGTSTSEKVLHYLLKLNIHKLWFSKSTLGHIYTHETLLYLHKNVPHSPIHRSRNLERAQKLLNGEMDN